MLSERVAGLTRALERVSRGLKGFHGSGFLIATVLMEAVSTHFFVQTLRSIIIAPNIFVELIPIVAVVLAAPFIAALLTLVCNDLFLGLVGALAQVVGRGLLLTPSDPERLLYFTGMGLSTAGYLLAFLGLFGATLKGTKVRDLGDAGRQLQKLLVGGVLLGMAANVALRLPNPAGMNLVEDVLFNVILLVAFTIVALYWYAGHDREHNILKDPLPTDMKRGKEKRFRKTVHLFMLCPCFAILGFYFNRPEW
ncbi:MAG: hypothetical protein JW839_02325, partial [Candidatus Lokiarchaeota archaeon]|nr:hypothetical protein [Candidatus Lokiarchaeota archaeon]